MDYFYFLLAALQILFIFYYKVCTKNFNYINIYEESNETFEKISEVNLGQDELSTF